MKRQKIKYIWGFQKILWAKNLPKCELRLCMYMFPLLANVLVQFSKSHLYGLSPVWMLVCSWNVTLVAKPLPQNSQLKGFWEFSVWNIVIWVFILDFGTSFPHVTHGNFSWTVLMCLFRTPLCWNSFPHIGHSIFLPVWRIMCRGIDPCLTCLPQIEQITFGMAWFLRCRSRFFCVTNFLPQSWCLQTKYSTVSLWLSMCFSIDSLALYWAPQR